MKDIIKFKKDADEIINNSSKEELLNYYNNIKKDIDGVESVINNLKL